MQFANDSLLYRTSAAINADLEQTQARMAHSQHVDPESDPQATTMEFGQTVVIASILTVLEILSALITIYQACKKTPAQALSDMQNPSLLSRLRLRKEIARHPECNGCGRALHGIILTHASKCTIVDVEQLYRETYMGVL